MRDYRDLQVWGKAHQLTLAVYKSTRGFPNEERFGLTSPAFLGFDSRKPGGRLRQKIRWRNGPRCADCDGLGC